MKPARLVVLGVAVAAGGLAALFARGGHQSAPPPPPPPVVETVDILVAKTDLSRGEVITGNDVGWQIWPKAAANPTFIQKSERPEAVKQFVGAIVRQAVASGEPIRDPSVVFANGSGFLAATLPRGRVAVSMEISAETDAGGFILPGDHVDILLTRRDKAAEKMNGGIEQFVTETILKNVQVLAVDQTVEEKDGKKVVVGKTATVELAPDQAETLAQARPQGTLSLALRSLLDSQSTVPESGNDDKQESKNTIDTVRYGIGPKTIAR